MKFSKKIVGFIIAINILFTAAILYVFVRVGNEPYALVGAWFAFTTVELWNLASIKKVESKAEKFVENIISAEDQRGE